MIRHDIKQLYTIDTLSIFSQWIDRDKKLNQPVDIDIN